MAIMVRDPTPAMAGDLAIPRYQSAMGIIAVTLDEFDPPVYQATLNPVTIAPGEFTSTLYIATIETVSSTTLLPGAVRFFMRAWDATAGHSVYWESDDPFRVPPFTSPAPVGTLTNYVVIGTK